ncbi:MAG: aconitase X catalytic domain-containing protein [Methanomicrobiales archaeon]|nr:aconitase X catalytic domain-containing protein [Methanomicrobiales archaeon]
MEIDYEDERVLAGEEGETSQKMMEILLALGKVFSARRLVPIRSAQVSGASYKTIGPYGLEWLSSLNARVAVPTVLNPVGMDRVRWREMGVGEDFARKQEEVIAAYSRLGVRMACTCTPYYLGETRYGDHLAWAESSAVSYANSVIGARTNREGGPGALAAAIIGKTPCYGLHLVANRRPDLVVEVAWEKPPSDPAEFGAIGYHVGKIVGNRVPYFLGIRPTREQMKALGAAMAATGAVALFHVEGITPEARIFTWDVRKMDRITVHRDDIEPLFADRAVDAVAIGCPHCSGAELAAIATALSGRRVTRPLWVFAARQVIEQNREAVVVIEGCGAKVFADTCMVVSPATEQFGVVMVNSGKAAAYVPELCGAAVRLGTLEDCLRAATDPDQVGGSISS